MTVAFLRNRIRFELIPLLERRFNPKIVVNLARAADILREEEDFLVQIEEEVWPRILKKEGEILWLEAEALADLHPAFARRLVRRFLFMLRGDIREINFKEVEALRHLGPGQRLHLKRQVKLIRLGPRIMEERRLQPFQKYEIIWDGEHPIEIPGTGLKFLAKKIKNKAFPPFDDSCRACLSLNRLSLPLVIRPRRPGDSYQPAGSRKPKKLKDLMSSRHIPVHLRAFWPVFISAGEIVWVPGCPINESFKIKGSESEIFIIERL